jgi:hypothetical protein
MLLWAIGIFPVWKMDPFFPFKRDPLAVDDRLLFPLQAVAGYQRHLHFPGVGDRARIGHS